MEPRFFFIVSQLVLFSGKFRTNFGWLEKKPCHCFWNENKARRDNETRFRLFESFTTIFWQTKFELLCTAADKKSGLGCESLLIEKGLRRRWEGRPTSRLGMIWCPTRCFETAGEGRGAGVGGDRDRRKWSRHSRVESAECHIGGPALCVRGRPICSSISSGGANRSHQRIVFSEGSRNMDTLALPSRRPIGIQTRVNNKSEYAGRYFVAQHVRSTAQH